MSNPKNSLQNRLQKTPPVFKKPVDKVVKIPTTKAPKPTPKTTVAATTKKGPWAHLPPWKQRMLKAARQKQLAARQAAQANGGQTLAQKNQQANKPALTKKPVQQKPGQIRPGQPRPGQQRPGKQ